MKDEEWKKVIDINLTSTFLMCKYSIKKMLKKYSLRDVVEFISKKENLPKKMIYNFCLKLVK